MLRRVVPRASAQTQRTIEAGEQAVSSHKVGVEMQAREPVGSLELSHFELCVRLAADPNRAASSHFLRARPFFTRIKLVEEVRVVVKFGIARDPADLPPADRQRIVIASDRGGVVGEGPSLRVLRVSGSFTHSMIARTF